MNAYLWALLRATAWPSRIDAHRRRWPASLPHDPFWNLMAFGGGRQGRVIPWECDWHGTVRAEHCDECRRECVEYRATGTWTTRG